MLIGFKSDFEKSQIILSFLSSGKSIPCPKLVRATPESQIPKDKRQPRNFASLVKAPVRSRYYFYFLCQKTRKVVNPDKPMVLELDKKWVKHMTHFIEMSLVAINIASREVDCLTSSTYTCTLRTYPIILLNTSYQASNTCTPYRRFLIANIYIVYAPSAVSLFDGMMCSRPVLSRAGISG